MNKYIQENNLFFIQSPIINGIPNTFHGFFTRIGGMSNHEYEGLNCGYHVGDDPAIVKQNISLVLKSLDQSINDQSTLYSNHQLELNHLTKKNLDNLNVLVQK